MKIAETKTAQDGVTDLVVKLEKERSATILEVAVAWDPLVKERTKQKLEIPRTGS